MKVSVIFSSAGEEWIDLTLFSSSVPASGPPPPNDFSLLWQEQKRRCEWWVWAALLSFSKNLGPRESAASQIVTPHFLFWCFTQPLLMNYGKYVVRVTWPHLKISPSLPATVGSIINNCIRTVVTINTNKPEAEEAIGAYLHALVRVDPGALHQVDEEGLVDGPQRRRVLLLKNNKKTMQEGQRPDYRGPFVQE